MPAGLQVFDQNGVLLVDTTTMLPRVFDIGRVTSEGSATIIPIAQGVQAGVPVVIDNTNQSVPNVVINPSSGLMTWSKRNGYAIDAQLRVVLV